MKYGECLDQLRRAIEHAPKDVPPPQKGLLGWKLEVDDGFLFICEHCSGRLFARGCGFPGASFAIWDERKKPQFCAVCGK